ncbi:MAG: hypothetical protein R3C03_15790 [Pirellulaceae bacterium]
MSAHLEGLTTMPGVWPDPLVVPSFYRPGLVRTNGPTDTTLNPQDSLGMDQRQYSFLPAMYDRNGNSVYFDDDGDGLIDQNYLGNAGQLDVDNDGDGLAESIWMDSNLPIQTDERGRVYKPLVAYHVVDMGGRLNVNVHGSRFEYDLASSTSNAQVTEYGFFNDVGLMPKPQGYGFGVGEVSLSLAFGSTGLTQRLFYGDATWYGRFGSEGQASGSFNVGPGQLGVVDNKAATKFAGFPNSVFVAPGLTNTGLYRSPLDVHGRYQIGTLNNLTVTTRIDPYDSTFGTVDFQVGMPSINATASGLTTGELVDSVYEMDLTAAPFTGRSEFVSTGGADDFPFSPAELEAFLSDDDMLPQRLRELLSAGTNLKKLITTDSYELPVLPRNVASLLDEARAVNGFEVEPDDLTTDVFARYRMDLNAADPLFARKLFTLCFIVCPPQKSQITTGME